MVQGETKICGRVQAAVCDKTAKKAGFDAIQQRKREEEKRKEEKRREEEKKKELERKNVNAWGPFKNREHFASLHIC